MRIAVQQHGVMLGLLLVSFLCLSTNFSLGVDVASRLDATDIDAISWTGCCRQHRGTWPFC